MGQPLPGHSLGGMEGPCVMGPVREPSSWKAQGLEMSWELI